MKNTFHNLKIIQSEFLILKVIALLIMPSLLIAGIVLGGRFGPYILMGAITALSLSIIVILRRDELAAMVVIAVQLIVDWYLGLHIVSQLMAIALLSLFFLARSPQYRWVVPRPLWPWVLFLLLAIPAVIQGDYRPTDLAYYYPNIFLGALVMFWLGTLVAKNKMCLRILFQALVTLGVLLAIHTIIEVTTGRFLFNTPSSDAYLAAQANFILANSGGISRAGSFLLNPDWNGSFFAIMLFLPLSLFAETTSFLLKILYFAETLLISAALLFTYSAGAWVSALGGMVAFILFAGHSYYRIWVSVFMVIIGATLVQVFPSQVNFLFQHALIPREASLRVGAWETAINIIKAFPLTGIGLGFSNYAQRAESYRVPAQDISLDHPHNSYLELGAMAGLPVLIIFLILLLFALWQAWRNWIEADRGTRCLVGGGIATVIVLSVNSVSINGWTLPPLAAIGWLVLGAITSPLIKKNQPGEKNNNGVFI